ncbi:hypothetical protein FM130_14325 [Enterococcus faecium]|nr:hypothetical protein FM130_14325 [Enterococcus faecium]
MLKCQKEFWKSIFSVQKIGDTFDLALNKSPNASLFFI